MANEERHDSPIKAQIVEDLVVDSSVTANTLRDLLLERYEVAVLRRGFKYHPKPTNVYIYAYASRELALAGNGLWLGMLQMSPMTGPRPEVTIREEDIARIGAAPEERHGLDESKRKQIFRDSGVMERRAAKEAGAKYPTDVKRQIKWESKRHDELKGDLLRRHGIPDDIYMKIIVEGLEKRWPSK